MELAVDHLADLGHRRIVRLRSMMPGGGGVYLHRGEKGFLDTAARRGLAETAVSINFIEWAELESLIPELCRKNFTGFIVTIYSNYGWLLDIFARTGKRIPDDLSLIVYNDHPLAEELKLTAIGIDYRETIRQAVRQLGENIEGAGVFRHHLIPATLRIRSSTGAPPAAGRREP